MSNWAELLAIIVGPIAAVAITLWYQARDRRYRQRYDVFRSLVLSRRNNLSFEFVNALNLVPILFTKDRIVMEKRRALMDLFNNGQWRSDDIEVRQRLLDRVETAVAELIKAVGRAVRVSIDDIEILKGAYAPQGWADDETQNRRARSALIELLEGRRPLAVFPLSPGGPAADSAGSETLPKQD